MRNVEYRMLNLKEEEFLRSHFHIPYTTFVDMVC